MIQETTDKIFSVFALKENQKLTAEQRKMMIEEILTEFKKDTERKNAILFGTAIKKHLSSQIDGYIFKS